MRDNLYFISVIDDAMNQSNRRTALRKAFLQIHRLGRQYRYQQGYRQFLHWIRAAALAGLQAESSGARVSTFSSLQRPLWLAVILQHDGSEIATGELVHGKTIVVENIAPGTYRLRLDTGSLVWEGTISQNGLFVGQPKRGQPLRMAAATTGIVTPRNEIHVLNGSLTLRLRPASAGWQLEIEPINREV